MKTNRLAVAALLTVGLMWGAAFVVMKDAINQQPYMDFLATRFTIAALAMYVLRPKIAMAVKPGDLTFGFWLGVVLALGYITQTIGLELTTASMSGFLTGLYVVLTPILGWLVLKKKISIRIALAALLSILGLAVLSGTATSVEFQSGQLWLIVCALCYAVHILLLGHFGPGRDPYRFAMLQIAAVALVCWIFALLDGYQAPPNAEVWLAILFTALLSTVLAFWVQTWAQTILDSSRVALLLTSEVVFTALISTSVGQEPLTWFLITGGSLMLLAMIIAEWPSKRYPVELDPKLHQ